VPRSIANLTQRIAPITTATELGEFQTPSVSSQFNGMSPNVVPAVAPNPPKRTTIELTCKVRGRLAGHERAPAAVHFADRFLKGDRRSGS